MSKKETRFFPKYRLQKDPVDYAYENRDVSFKHQDTFYICTIPRLGITETQKRVLKWFEWNRTAPVMSISHEKPTKPDQEILDNSSDLHYHYYPYAMAIVTVQVLGEVESRQVKVYFCTVELHENSLYRTVHLRSKGTRIVPCE